MNNLEAKRDELQAELDTLKGELRQLPEGQQRTDREQAYLLVWSKLRRIEATLEAEYERRSRERAPVLRMARVIAGRN